MTDRFDPAKDAINRAKHDISLGRAFDMEIVRFIVDERYDYGEVRYRAWGFIDGRGYFLAFTLRDGAVWPISLRRAHDKEMRKNAG
ncbi:MAG: BrnT family toxin [Pseudolabrys sp.]